MFSKRVYKSDREPIVKNYRILSEQEVNDLSEDLLSAYQNLPKKITTRYFPDSLYIQLQQNWQAIINTSDYEQALFTDLDESTILLDENVLRFQYSDNDGKSEETITLRNEEGPDNRCCGFGKR